MKSEEVTYRTIRLLLLLATVLLLNACSDDPSPEGQRVSAEVMSCSTGFEEIADRMGTRAWRPPSNYYLYSHIFGPNGMFAAQKDLAHKSIKAFFTQGTDVQERFFYYRETQESKWHMDADLENGSTSSPFQLYGYIPVEDAEGANISPLSDNYSNGAILTINGLSTITPSDVCVIIGAKDGRGEEDDTGETVTSGESDGIRVTPGKFDVKFNAGDNASNYIFLLFDHIYSSLRFRFTVDATYYALRRIRLTKLELIAYAGESGGGVKAKYDATIKLQKNNTGTSPIVGNISFTPTSGSSDVAFTSLYEWDEAENTQVVLDPNTQTNFMGSFVPGVNTYFKLRSTYDVFDTHGNLIRKDCQAENTIDLRQKFEISQTLNGHCYSYTIKVQPTYLYVLSEPDVDNPTVVVN